MESSPDAAPSGKLRSRAVTFRFRALTILEIDLIDCDNLTEIKPLIADHPYLRIFPNFKFKVDDTLVKEAVPLSEQVDESSEPLAIEVVLEQFNIRTAEIHILNCCSFFLKPERFLNDAFLEFYLAQGKTDFISELIEQQDFKSKPLPVEEYLSPDLSILRQASFLDKEKSEGLFFQMLAYSKHNPLSSAQKTHNEFFYLDLTTLEGASYCITVSKGGLYVNNLSATQAEPVNYSSLIDLIKGLSPKAEIHLNLFLNPNQPETCKKYLGVRMIPDGISDSAFAWVEESETTSEKTKAMILLQNLFAHKSLGKSDRVFKDWNEDLQNLKSVPAKDISQLLNLAKYMRKYLEEFADSSKELAKAILNQEILPLNSSEKVEESCYVFNNLFGTFAVESEKWELPKSDSAPTTYSNVNADIRNLKTLFLADIPGLHSINTCCVDYKGSRILVQSLIQGILHFDQKTWSIYGTVDEGKTIKADPRASELIKKLCEIFQLKLNSNFVDSEEVQHQVHGTPEIKGIQAGDGRIYVMDLMRLSPRDANYPDPVQHEACVLRPELIRNYRLFTSFEEAVKAKNEKLAAQAEKDKQAAEAAKSEETKEVKEEKETKEVKETQESKEEEGEEGQGEQEPQEKNLALDPSLLTGLESKNESHDLDLATLKKVSEYLLTHCIPYFITEVTNGSVLAVLDQASLVEEVHKLGINVRYLGKIYSMLNNTQHAFVKKLIVRTVLVKSIVKLVREIVAADPSCDFQVLITHVLNSFLGDNASRAQLDNKQEGKKTHLNGSAHEDNAKNGRTSKDEPVADAADSEAAKKKNKNKKKKKTVPLVSSELLSNSSSLPLTQDILDKIKTIALEKYGLDLKDFGYADLIDYKNLKERLTFLRDVSRALGVVLARRLYEFKENSSEQSIRAKDIVDVRPKVKYASYLLEGLRANIKAGDAEIAAKNYEAAISIFKGYQQLVINGYGIYNSDFIYVTSKLAATEAICKHYANAIKHQLLVVKVSERVYGLDSHHTAQFVLELANMYSLAKKPQEAISLQGFSVYLFDLIGGPLNPMSIMSLHELLTMCSETPDVRLNTIILEELLKRNAQLFGDSDERLLYYLQKLAECKAEVENFDEASLCQARHSLILTRLLKNKALDAYPKLKGDLEIKLAESNKIRDAYMNKRVKKTAAPVESAKTSKKK